MSNGSAGASVGASIGDAVHSNSNDTVSMFMDYKAMMQEHYLLIDELNFEKEKFGLQFALKKLMAMAELNAMEKQMIMIELQGREKVRTSALDRQMKEYDFRKQLESEDRKKKVGKSLMLGFAKVLKGQGKRGGEGTQPAPATVPDTQEPTNVLSGLGGQ